MKQKLLKWFPWLRTIRNKQMKFCFYLKMFFDSNHYSKEKGPLLPYILYQNKDNLINTQTECNVEYQYNKVYNLKLASTTVNQIYIKPQETFSFWQLVRFADKKEKYKDGLTLNQGTLTTIKGGGLCALSNLLFDLFLHSPLTILERHTHTVKSFPSPTEGSLEGIDATIVEGLLDLKVKNETEQTFQIIIDITDKELVGILRISENLKRIYEVYNKNLEIYEENGKTYERVEVWRRIKQNNEIIEDICLYINKTRLGYDPKKENLI